MTDPMNPEDVPEELVRLFDEGSLRAAHAAMGVSSMATEKAYMRGGLAAALPAYAAMVMRDVTVKQWGETLEGIVNDSVNERVADLEKGVRAKVAAELHARADAATPGTGFKRGLRAAAHHANPTTIEDAARALQAMYERDIARGEDG